MMTINNKFDSKKSVAISEQVQKRRPFIGRLFCSNTVSALILCLKVIHV